MEYLHLFPHINASLNALSGVFLITGFFFIRNKRVSMHRTCMLTASIISSAFLVSYLTHHTLRTYFFGLGPTQFTGEGLARPIYFTILLSHTILAAAVVPFVLLTLYRGLTGKYDTHRNIARLTFPVWLYVSITGVAVYLMLYQIYPGR